MSENVNREGKPAESTEEREAGTSGGSGSLIGPSAAAASPGSVQSAVPEAAIADPSEARGDTDQTGSQTDNGPVNPLDAASTGGTVFQRPDPNQLKPNASSVAAPPLNEDTNTKSR